MEATKTTNEAILQVNHNNWLRQDLTAYHLKKLEEQRELALRSAENASVNYALENRQEIILSKLVKAKTIAEIINYVKSNQYPS